jgi:hypothetical protein
MALCRLATPSSVRMVNARFPPPYTDDAEDRRIVGATAFRTRINRKFTPNPIRPPFAGFCLSGGIEQTRDSGPFDKEWTDCGIQRNVTKIKNA